MAHNHLSKYLVHDYTLGPPYSDAGDFLVPCKGYFLWHGSEYV